MIGVLSLAVAYYLWGKNLAAQWGILDDHDIFALFGDDLKVRPSEIPSALRGALTFELTGYYRGRFSACFLRTMEAALWGPSPFRWYLSRLLQFAVFFALLWRVLGKFIPSALAFLFCLYVFTDRYWGDVWSRLGPCESYAAVGLALYSLSFYNLWQRIFADRPRTADWLLFTAGGMIAAGSKENFTFLLLPTLLLAAVAYQKKVLSPGHAVIAGLGVAYTVSIVIWALHVAATRAMPSHFLASLLKGFQTNTPLHLLLLVIAVLYATTFFAPRLREIKPVLRCTLLVEAVLFLIYLSQYTFYSGLLPHGGAHDFPATLAIRLGFIAPVICLFQGQIHSKLFKLAVAMVLVTAVAARGYEYAPHYCQANVDATRRFSSRLSQVIQAAKAHPAAALVLVSHSAGDFEPIFSLQRYLHAYGVKNPLVLRISYSAATMAHSPEARNLAGLAEGMARGSGGFSPPEALLRAGECYSVFFGGEHGGEERCTSLGAIWP